MSDRRSAFEEYRIRVYDGLEIYGRHYPAVGSKRRPLLCLAGLTRNSRDFHDLAVALSGEGSDARPVYTVDTRGRGASEFALDWRQYAVPVEMLDVQDFIMAHHLHGAAVLGTSRGGLISMVLAAAQPTSVGAVVLNDIGPVIDRDGLTRISSFIGRKPTPTNWESAAHRLAEAEKILFPNATDDDWLHMARQRFNEKDGKPAPGYDPEIARTFAALSDGPVPPLWNQFMALKHVPCLVVRGGLSDLLSKETVSEMVTRHPNCRAHEVPLEGHAPRLEDDVTQSVISEFLKDQDDTWHGLSGV